MAADTVSARIENTSQIRQEPKANSLAGHFEEIMSGMKGRSDTDIQGSAWKGLLNIDGSGLEFDSGVVIDGCPSLYAYLVNTSSFGRIWCSTLSQVGGQIIGARQFSSITVGTPVLVARSKNSPTSGVIISVMPKTFTSGLNMPPDRVWQFNTSRPISAARYIQNRVSSFVLGMQSPRREPMRQAEVEDYSFGRPRDVQASGQYGIFSETGVGIYLDSFQTFVRVDEFSGIFCFYLDSLVRIAAKNWQFFTMLEHEYQYYDEGELFKYTCKYVYPHEVLGLRSINQITEGIDFQAQRSAAGKATATAGAVATTFTPEQYANLYGICPLEPLYTDQIGMPRWHEWEGYLGQGRLRILAAPWQLPQAVYDQTKNVTVQHFSRNAMYAMFGHPNFNTSSVVYYPSGRLLYNGTFSPPFGRQPVFRRGQYLFQPGLFQEAVTLTGKYIVTSATGIHFIKQPNIIVPKWANRPESPAGDKYGNYSFSGVANLLGNAYYLNNHLIRENLNLHFFPSNIAFMLNWQILHPFFYHSRDWFLYEDKQGIPAQFMINFSEALSHPHSGNRIGFSNPPTIKLDIDHRYGQIDVYLNRSGISLMGDGSVIIFDGWGSQITMSKGCIEISAALDIVLRPGRNFDVSSGWKNLIYSRSDTVIFPKGNLALQSPRNISIVSSSYWGGILIQSNSQGFCLPGDANKRGLGAGIVLDAPNSQIVSISKNNLIKAERIIETSNLRSITSGDIGIIASGNFTLAKKNFYNNNYIQMSIAMLNKYNEIVISPAIRSHYMYLSSVPPFSVPLPNNMGFVSIPGCHILPTDDLSYLQDATDSASGHLSTANYYLNNILQTYQCTVYAAKQYTTPIFTNNIITPMWHYLYKQYVMKTGNTNSYISTIVVGPGTDVLFDYNNMNFIDRNSIIYNNVHIPSYSHVWFNPAVNYPDNFAT